MILPLARSLLKPMIFCFEHSTGLSAIRPVGDIAGGAPLEVGDNPPEPRRAHRRSLKGANSGCFLTKTGDGLCQTYPSTQISQDLDEPAFQLQACYKNLMKVRGIPTVDVNISPCSCFHHIFVDWNSFHRVNWILLFLRR